MGSKTKLDFEAAMARLDGISRKLESGDVPLEKAIELFEEGLQLSDRCGHLLDHAQSRVDTLLEGRDGAEVRAPLEPGS